MSPEVEAIHSAYARAQQLRDLTLSTAADACQAALECGDLLIAARSHHNGEFLLWFQCNCPQISESTAWNYMRISKLRRALGDRSVDLQTIKQFYIAAGILPPRAAQSRNAHGQVLQFWSFATKIRNWLPVLPDGHTARLRAWWEDIGRAKGWI
jgi:hypothetical protein